MTWAQVGTLCLGLLIGYITCVFTEVRGLQKQIYELRKQGFVPHFSVNAEPEYDPSEEVREY